MKRLLTFLSLLAAGALWADSVAVTNTFLTVDQNGRMNVRGVATVEDVATNAVKVQVAEAKLAAVEEAVAEARAEANALAENILSNNVVVYRHGFSEGFQAVVVITTNDHLTCTYVRKKSYSGTTATFELGYVCLADLSGITPTILAHDTLVGGKAEFEAVPAADVGSPQWHAGDLVIGGITFSGYFTVEFTMTLAANPAAYFTYIEVSGDAPSAAGMGVDMPHGVAGGWTGTIGGGWDIDVVGGVITGVSSE